MKKDSQYISFVGFFDIPTNCEEFKIRYPIQYYEISEGIDSHDNERFREVSTGFREGLDYKEIDGKDSLTVYLAIINEQIGHLVASCPAGGWADECFVQLDETGQPIKSNDNYNPNPIEQLL